MANRRDDSDHDIDSATSALSQRLGRRELLLSGAALGATSLLPVRLSAAAESASIDLAPVAALEASTLTSRRRIEALFRTEVPNASADRSLGLWSSWPSRDAQWIELRWSEAITTNRIEVYWAADARDMALPRSARLLYWNGSAFAPVGMRTPLGVAADRFNTVSFAALRTDRLRLEVEAAGKSVGVLRWRVMSSGVIPLLAPAIAAGVDRSVVRGGRSYLSAEAIWLQREPGDTLHWTKVSGPGEVMIENPTAAVTSARFSHEGDYELRLTGTAGNKSATSSLRVRVVSPPPDKRLDVVYTTPYSIDSPLWNARCKSLVVSWIPHCIAYCERTDLPTGRGGLDNFIEAAKALRGEPHNKHQGYVFSNAWVHQTVESMCLALMVEAKGDAQIEKAQAGMRATLERWIPIILAAQHPDGYLQTAYTLADRKDWPERWSPDHRANHEGYVSGYFIESAINHYTLTGGRDLRLYQAAKRLADCWVAHIGPGRKKWFDGHQEMEQALVRFGRFVNDVEGAGRGDAYVVLARFLLDSREGGSEYDQSHLPPIKQYDAVGHAVRAVYFYSGMADIAAETGDVDYQSAVISLWDNMVNRKYYVTGGVGSGDTSEGFGGDFALRQDAYCESCSSCGLIFFQYKMHLAYHDARYADLLEETMYNALLGGIDYAGESFCYTNPLVDTDRAKWHSCPCCVANISRTLLMAPTWAYAKAPNALFVNMFIGSRVNVGEVAGTKVEMVQKTDYPWMGEVAITVNPTASRRFALHVRVPNRATSELYASSPPVAGLARLRVNGKSVPMRIRNGYAVIEREWQRGDRVEFQLPMTVQRIRASEKIAATRGQEALRYGPLIFTVEKQDQPDLDEAMGTTPSPVWKSELLGGTMALEGQWADGSAMRAIPYHLRANRTGTPLREFPVSDGQVNYAPGTSAGAGTPATNTSLEPLPASRVWLTSKAI